MLLKASPSTSLASAQRSFCSQSAFRQHLPSSASPSLTFKSPPLRVCATISPDLVDKTLTGFVFQPFVEVQDQLVKIPASSSESFARQRYSVNCEGAINEQINVEYNVSYVYHTLFAYFDRDNVGLPGFAQFFKESSDEERTHAEMLMKYQNRRGGKVKLQSIVMPPVTEFNDLEKGDALCAMELTLAMEKLVNEKLLQLHKVAVEQGDPQLQDFIEGEFLKTQVKDVKKISGYVSQLRRVGKGHGVYHFDLVLQGKGV